MIETVNELLKSSKSKEEALTLLRRMWVANYENLTYVDKILLTQYIHTTRLMVEELHAIRRITCSDSQKR